MWSLLCFSCWVGWENGLGGAAGCSPLRCLPGGAAGSALLSLKPSFPGAGSPGREALARRALGGAFVLESPGFQELE